MPVLLSTLNGISYLRIHMPKDLRPIGPRETVWKSVLEVQRRSPDGIPFLDPIENMGIKDEKFKVLVKVSSRLYRFSYRYNICPIRESKLWNKRCL